MTDGKRAVNDNQEPASENDVLIAAMRSITPKVTKDAIEWDGRDRRKFFEMSLSFSFGSKGNRRKVN